MEQSFTEERIAWVFSHQDNASGIRALLRDLCLCKDSNYYLFYKRWNDIF